MKEFPDFMKNPTNKIDPRSQYTPGIEGYVFDGADGSQIAFWTYGQTARSNEHSHDFDEYIAVIQGQYTIFLSNKKILLHPGDEYVIPKTVVHSGEAVAGTRAFFAFGGKRAEREIRNQ